MRSILLFLGVITVCIFCPYQSFAADFYVTENQSTIQSSIDAALTGDTIYVNPGIYTENISFAGKAVAVIGLAGAEQTTIQAANSNLPVVSFTSSEPRGAMLAGFTITGSNNSGIRCDYSSPTILDNIITGNSSSYTNGGAGIDMNHTSGALVRGNNIYGNIADTYGAGIHMDWSVGDTICYNQLHHNIGLVEIRCLSTEAFIHNNTISATNWSGVSLDDGHLKVWNNIIFFAVNYAVQIVTGTCEADFNCVYANAADYLNVSPGPGSITDYAMFADSTNGIYYLLTGSPCIDAGDPDPWFNDSDGSRNDMGALSFGDFNPDDYDGDGVLNVDDNCPYHFNPGQLDSDGDGVGDECDTRVWYVKADGTGDAPTIQAAIDAAHDGDSILVGPGVYNENINFLGKLIVVHSEAGRESTTILAADANIPVVQLVSSEVKGTELSGFTITGSNNSGISCHFSSPTILDNIITSNSSSYYNGGAGIDMNHTSGAMVRGNNIYGNIADTYGAGIHTDGSVGDTICYNQLHHNIGLVEIRCLSTEAFIHNNTISATNWSGVSLDDGHLKVWNNIIFFAANYAVQIVTGTCEADFNCVYANAADYLNVSPGPGSITDYAMFADSANGDYTLSPESPCINAGDPDPWFNDPDGSRNDMGALPLCDCSAQGDCNDDGVLSPLDIVYLVAYAFRGGEMPPADPACPVIHRGDINCDGRCNPVDVVILVYYIYRNQGSGPCDPCTQ